MKEDLTGQVKAAQEYFDRSTRLLTDEHSGFRPSEGMFTATQQIAHVAQTIEWFVDGAFNPNGFDLDFERLTKELDAVTTVTAARAWFKQACEKACEVIEQRTETEWASPLPPGPIMGGIPKLAILGALTDHTAHHRGALTVYARLLGIVPPMPYMEM